MAKLISKETDVIPKEYSPAERQAIAQDVVDFIRDRTDGGVDKNNVPFPKYSKEYTKSDEFKLAGKSKGRVNLKLSADMMEELKVLSTKKGSITYGYEKGSAEIPKATGNILGTYGQASPIKGKKRDFLGISKSDLVNILKKYPLKRRGESKERARLVNALVDMSDKKAKEYAATMVAEGRLTIDIVNEVLEDQDIEQL